jgi:hypothetical protein
MSACTNCGTKLSCGCQKRTASDGRAVCGTCLSGYEASIKNKTAVKSATTNVIYQKK